jgi:hypothetical protein
MKAILWIAVTTMGLCVSSSAPALAADSTVMSTGYFLDTSDRPLSVEDFSRSLSWSNVVNSANFKDLLLDFSAARDEDEKARADKLADTMKGLDLDTLTLIKAGSTPCTRISCNGFAADFVVRLAGFIVDELVQSANAAQAEAMNKGNEASRNIALGALATSIISAVVAGTVAIRKWNA